ncbi:MAG: DNA-processing protein DprA [Elusimicrobiota bacterium]|jgi:DNA processing protein|nr:DNA-processing protein DprA [Elusimicrobiota bacterium]
MLTYDEQLAWIKINAFSYLRADWLDNLFDIFKTGAEILKQDAHTLSEESKISLQTAQNFLKLTAALDAEREMERTQKAGGKIVFKGHSGYPQALLDIKEPPLALYIRGSIDEDNAVPVAIVGTRKITPYGRRAASQLAQDLVSTGVTLVSGLARGIDSCAHAASVRAGRPTWALIGTGIGRCYPAENRELAIGVLDNGGAIISELPFDAAPLAPHFPRRNRLIAGLSKVVCVIEGEAKSGALITAKMALEQGKDVLAVPGPIDSPQSAGTNRLIKDGAAMITSALDIIDALPLDCKVKLNTKNLEAGIDAPQEGFSAQEKLMLEAIGEGSKTIDDIALIIKSDISEIAGILFTLEVSGAVMCQDGKYSKRKI